jgi:Transposase IS116/IS110/IS902 family
VFFLWALFFWLLFIVFSDLFRRPRHQRLAEGGMDGLRDRPALPRHPGQPDRGGAGDRRAVPEAEAGRPGADGQLREVRRRLGRPGGADREGQGFRLSFGLAFASAIMLATLSLSFTHLANASSVLRPGQQEQVAKALDGTAPVAASSGPNQRHRLNRAGNRRMNKAIHMMALTQPRMDPRARAYVARRCDEGRTRREATRALKPTSPTSSIASSAQTLQSHRSPRQTQIHAERERH